MFFFLAGLAALVMRDQLASPNNNVLAPETYNQLFTMHGTTMIFLFNTPVLAGFGNYLIPLQIGCPGHGLSPPQRLQLLDLPLRRRVPVLQRRWSANRPTAGGSPTCP